MPTLDELIAERKRLRGFSYADLENRAASTISRQRWQQLGTGVRIKEFPEPATLEAMATALDVDVAEVVLAAARSIGLDVKRGAQSDLAARLPSTADRLTEVQRDAIVTLVRSITEVQHELEDSSQPGAPGEASEVEKTLAGELREVGRRRRNVRAHRGAQDGTWQSTTEGLAQDAPDELPTAARRGGGKSEGRRRREQQDRDAEG